MSFGCERSCSSHRRVLNFNSKVPPGGIYPHIKFEREVEYFSSKSVHGVRVYGLRAAADEDAVAATAMLKP